MQDTTATHSHFSILPCGNNENSARILKVPYLHGTNTIPLECITLHLTERHRGVLAKFQTVFPEPARMNTLQGLVVSLSRNRKLWPYDYAVYSPSKRGGRRMNVIHLMTVWVAENANTWMVTLDTKKLWTVFSKSWFNFIKEYEDESLISLWNIILRKHAESPTLITFELSYIACN